MKKKHFVYVVQNLRLLADSLEEENFETGDLDGVLDELRHIAEIVRDARQYITEKEVSQ